MQEHLICQFNSPFRPSTYEYWLYVQEFQTLLPPSCSNASTTSSVNRPAPFMKASTGQAWLDFDSQGLRGQR